MYKITTKKDYLDKIGGFSDSQDMYLRDLLILRSLWRSHQRDDSEVETALLEDFASRISRLTRVNTGFDVEQCALIIVAYGKVSGVYMTDVDEILGESNV